MAVKRFIGKPVEVTGILWDGTNFEEIRLFCNGLAHTKRINGETVLNIETTEGTSRARIGDTILRGTQGEFYPVKPEVLRDKYEELDD